MTTGSGVPVIDLGSADVPRQLDEALSSVGFFLVTGHGVPAALPARVRAAARAFFALPDAVKRRYAVTVAGRGWLPPGVEANGYAEGTPTPPDLKESFAVGADTPTGDPAADAYWFPANVWPAEVPELQAALTEYLAAARGLADDLLRLCGEALGAGPDLFTRHATHPTHTLNVNWYPGRDVVGAPLPGQFRIGPHTDFGTVTVLDREPGAGGLQVWTDENGWQDAPFVPGSLTINSGDLLAHWSGGRWRSNRHRVLPPPADVPAEDLVSLVLFYEADHDAVATPVPPPIGARADLAPVVAGDFIRERLDRITIG